MSQAEIVPPEELLAEPPSDPIEEFGPWTVVARNERVNRKWEQIINRAPENALRWYRYLRQRPMARYPKRVFPLLGSIYQGAWECEVTGGDRLFYVPDESNLKVDV